MDHPDRTLDNPGEQGDLRARIAAAAGLIASGGRDAATTRAVATAAGVQAPTIYRLFGDKRGLLDAVARHALDAYILEKDQREPHPDPVQELRDPGLSAAAREAVIGAITGESVPPAAPGTRGVAAALRARLDDISVLTAGERHLLGELLDRVADGA